MEWKSRRRDVPERLEPSLSSGALAEEEGLDRFIVVILNGEIYNEESSVINASSQACIVSANSMNEFAVCGICR